MLTLATVSDLEDRRARKKARTRTEIRTVAQELFDEHGFDGVTIADIARRADVAVQTVFNHFASKEELFFDGRVPWVDGPAQAVRSRLPGESALEALRHYLVDLTYRLLTAHGSADRRRQMATQQASPVLQSYERELVFAAETRLSDALAAAWAEESAASHQPALGLSPAVTPGVTAAMFLTTTRTIVSEQRQAILAGADAGEIATVAADACGRLLTQLEHSVYAAAAAVTESRNTAAAG